jgi:hypothetical protein
LIGGVVVEAVREGSEDPMEGRWGHWEMGSGRRMDGA